MALIRYPGSKAKLWQQIATWLPDEMTCPLWSQTRRWEYREPFFGAGAIGFQILEKLSRRCKVWLNDKDYWLVCLWNTVLVSPNELNEQIAAFKPTAEAFYKFKAEDGAVHTDPCKAAFQKLACHQMSVSGFGVKSGGPLGGRDQANAAYPVDCRWNPTSLQLEVLRLHSILSKFATPPRITCYDYSDLLKKAPRERCAIYIDPPYVKQGSALYKHAMVEQQHRELAEHVSKLKCFWAVSYDDDPLVRDLYRDHDIHELPVVYTNATGAQGKRPKNHEVLIVPRQAVLST